MGKTTRSVKKCFLRENKSVRNCDYTGERLFAFHLSVSPVTGTPRNCLCPAIWHRLVREYPPPAALTVCFISKS